MSLVSIAYANTSIAIQPFDNENPNRRLFMDDVAEQFVWWDDVLGIELFRIGGSGGSSVGFHMVTYAQLFALVGINGLVDGDFYLLTDFATRHIIPNTAVVNTGAIEPLFLQATATNLLNQNAKSMIYPQDEISYELIDSTTAGGNKGRIYFRRDTVNNNQRGYDWRTVLFRRWETAPASGIFTVLTDNGGAFNDYYAFLNSPTASGCTNNIFGSISDIAIANFGAPSDKLDNFLVVGGIGSFMLENQIAPDCWDNTVFMPAGGNFAGNNISHLFNNNTFTGTNITVNTFGIFAQNNTTGTDFSGNILGVFFQNNAVGDFFELNTIGGFFQNNTIGNGFSINKISDIFQNNTIGNSFSVNILSYFFSSNVIGNDFAENEIGSGFDTNNIGDSCSKNEIQDNFISNLVINGFTNNTIGNDFTNNVNIQNNFQKNHIESGLSGIDFNLSTLVYGDYSKTIFKNNAGSYRLSYIDNTDTVIYANPNA